MSITESTFLWCTHDIAKICHYREHLKSIPFSHLKFISQNVHAYHSFLPAWLWPLWNLHHCCPLHVQKSEVQIKSEIQEGFLVWKLELLQCRNLYQNFNHRLIIIIIIGFAYCLNSFKKLVFNIPKCPSAKGLVSTHAPQVGEEDTKESRTLHLYLVKTHKAKYF